MVKFAGLNILVVAAQGRGKSQWVKNWLKNFQHRENCIYDFRGEYDFPNKTKGDYDYSEFLNLVPIKTKSRKNVVFEDASGFFGKGVMPKILRRHLSIKRGSENMNIFVYHGLTEFSKDNLKYFDFVVLFRTQEPSEAIEKNFSGYDTNVIKLRQAWYDVQKATENTFFDTVTKKYGNGTKENELFSKQWYHYNKVIRITA